MEPIGARLRRNRSTLDVVIDFSTGVNTGCAAAMPSDWLFGVPLVQLPEHVLVAVVTAVGKTTVRLP
jgi:hypothetical protein